MMKNVTNSRYAKPKNQSSFPHVFSGNLCNGCPTKAFGHDGFTLLGGYSFCVTSVTKICFLLLLSSNKNMPQNHKNTKAHKMKFEHLPQELEIIRKKIVDYQSLIQSKKNCNIQN